MSDQSDLEALYKRCERSFSKMTDDEALKHIGQLIDDSYDASFERGAKRALYFTSQRDGGAQLPQYPRTIAIANCESHCQLLS